MNRTKTAVEYLLEQMGLEQLIFPKEIVDKAKEMEKQQIIDAYDEGVYLAMTPSKTAEDYYQQTFKNK